MLIHRNNSEILAESFAAADENISANGDGSKIIGDCIEASDENTEANGGGRKNIWNFPETLWKNLTVPGDQALRWRDQGANFPDRCEPVHSDSGDITKEITMSNSLLPTKDQALIAWANNFVTVATANLATLGLTASDLNTLAGGGADLSTNLDTLHSLKQQTASTYTERDSNKKLINSSARGLIKRVEAAPGVSDTLKTLLGIPVPSGIVNRTPPVTPASLLATPHADGFNALKWHPAGNKPSTTYVILAKPVTSPTSATTEDGWAMVGTTTRSAFKHMGVTPGAPMAYRVMASRAENISNPSLPATVYTS